MLPLAPPELDRMFDIDSGFVRFNQRNDIFNRAVWDERIHPGTFFESYDIANYKPSKSKGFDHWDYAFRNASWHLTDVVGERNFQSDGTVEGFTDFFTLQTDPPAEPVQLDSPEETTRRIKIAARMFGAGAVGVCRLDRRWVYSHRFNRKTGENPVLDLPEPIRYVIVLILPMDYRLGRTFPSALSGGTTGLGYADSLQAATTLAQFITNLGFEAIASMNDTALNIPLAIEAGLGEYGRNGLLITPQFGPNVRIAKVLTDLPLVADRPRTFGVQKFCAICRKCADACPPKAVPSGDPQGTPPNLSSHRGITKWTVNAERCFKFWVGMNSDCAICIRVCPYNKDYSKWWNRLGVRLA
ncbi:MAG: reductive dehalogenase domain-containing protein, partial [Saprospiraceae bacterium]|nr:reductive dehalogenase domain-containing protein [Saprospiraceae bacterium]